MNRFGWCFDVRMTVVVSNEHEEEVEEKHQRETKAHRINVLSEVHNDGLMT